MKLNDPTQPGAPGSPFVGLAWDHRSRHLESPDLVPAQPEFSSTQVIVQKTDANLGHRGGVLQHSDQDERLTGKIVADALPISATFAAMRSRVISTRSLSTGIPPEED